MLYVVRKSECFSLVGKFILLYFYHVFIPLWEFKVTTQEVLRRSVDSRPKRPLPLHGGCFRPYPTMGIKCMDGF